MKKRKHKHDDWLGLYCDGNFNFIKGHVTEDEAKKITTNALRDKYDDASLIVTELKITHHNARFGIGHSEYGEIQQHLYTNRPTGEKGSFPVTEVEYSINIWE